MTVPARTVGAGVEGGQGRVDLLAANLELVPAHLRHASHLDRVDAGQATDGRAQLDRARVLGRLQEQGVHLRPHRLEPSPELRQLLVGQV